MYRYFLNTNILFYITELRGCVFYERGRVFFDITDFDTLWTTKERTDGNTEETIHVS
jgi:hypothetical protein